MNKIVVDSDYSFIFTAYRNSWTLDARVGRWNLDSELWTLETRPWTLNRGRWTLYA